MRRRVRNIITRVAAFSLALYMLATPAFAIVREVEVYGAWSINDRGDSDHRIDMDGLKEDYSDFVQTDTLREYFHKDQDNPRKVDLDQSLSWLVDNNIISRDNSIVVSNVKPNEIPEISIEKFDVNELKAMNLTRTDLLMYVYKAVYGPINARTIAVETDNIRVDDGEYITLYDLMIKNGYNPDPNTHLPGSGMTIIPGSGGAAGGTGGGAGSPGGDGGAASGANHQTNYLDDFGNWRYQPQGDLWESIFGDTNIFISQNNFQQQITGGNGGAGGGGGAGVGSGGTGGGGGANTAGQDQTNNTFTGDYNTGDSHDTLNGGNGGNSGTSSGTGVAGDFSTNTGGGGGGGGAANTGDNFIDYDTDYKQIYFIPGADMLFYENNEVPEVYIQAALSRGVLNFDSTFRTEEFEKEFVQWPKDHPNTRQSWEKNSPAYVVNRQKNVLRTVTDTEQVATQVVLGTSWNVVWQNNTLTITRPNAFRENSGYFSVETVSKMDTYRYIYNFVYDKEKSLSELETEIVNFKYGMELDGITNEADTFVLKYLIAKGILNFDNTSELVELASPMTWSTFLTVLRRVADPDSRLDFTKIQLTDSESSWKAKGYAPQTQHIIPGEALTTIRVMTEEEFRTGGFEELNAFGNGGVATASASTVAYSFDTVASQTLGDGTTLVKFGVNGDTDVIVTDSVYGEMRNQRVTTTFEGALYNSASDNGDYLDIMGDAAAAESEFGAAGVSVGIDSNIGKYALALVYRMCSSPVKDLEAAYPYDTPRTTPKWQLGSNIICNIWAISDMWESSTRLDVSRAISAGLDFAKTEEGKAKMKDNVDAYIVALEEMKTLYSDMCTNGDGAPKSISFLFYLGNVETVTGNWVQTTGGNIETVINRIEGLQFTIRQSDGTPITLTYYNDALGNGEVRGSIDQSEPDFVSVIGNGIKVSAVTELGPLVGEHWTEEMKEDAVRSYGNSVGNFAVFDSVQSTTDILTYVDPETNEDFVAWSTLERYKQQYESSGRKFPITKISDYVLYNEETQTYAYFSNQKDSKVALVGTDVISGNSDYGVVYKESSEIYYLTEAVRLLMDAKQEAEILGSLRSMPMASLVVQNNIKSISVDDNSGADRAHLTGITVMLTPYDSQVKDTLPEDSVYFTKPDVYNDIRWGDFIAISSANRAINATSRRFNYTTADGTKKTAYAVVIFEPMSISEIETVTVSPNSSLQDLLDAPQRMPETEKGKGIYEENMKLCNAFANWIYKTQGRDYISTGYLKPHAYIYAQDEDVTGYMSQADWGPLNETQRGLVEAIGFRNIVTGAVIKFGTNYSKWNKDNVRADPDHMAGYFLSKDYRICILGDRLYMNLGCFKNISTYTDTFGTKLKTTGLVAGTSAFTVGSTFRVKPYSSVFSTISEVGFAPDVTVMKTESDGTVTCQVGPVYGVPIVYNKNTSAVIRDYRGKSTSVSTLGEYDWESSKDNLLMYVYEKMFTTEYTDITYEGITTQPYLKASNNRTTVFDGTSLWKMGGSGNTKIEDSVDLTQQGTDYMRTASKCSTLVENMNSLKTLQNRNITYNQKAETYFTIKFNAFYYTLENGVLTYSPNQASDYISPSLFVSMNDLIINGMMNADNGAIPIEELPFGSILEVGTGYYGVTGTSAEDMSFVGYAPLDIQDLVLNRATVQDVAQSYATQFIRVGSQNLNVSHFFSSIEVMPDNGTDKQRESLNLVRGSVLSANQNPKTAIFGSAGAMNDLAFDEFMTGNPDLYTIYYAPVELKFYPGILMAYPTSPQGKTPVVYELVSMANSSVSGALSDLPFFAENIMTTGLIDRVATQSSGGFIKFYGASSLMAELRADFKRGFAGDLFTLARMLVFIVLVWLVVASWMCYATYFGGLMPILDAIRYPTGSRQGKGIDLMKIVSLGSISMETDFKLGRFIQYNLVLAALIGVVWVTGIYF